MENLKVDDVSKTSNPHKVTKNYPDDYRRQGFNMNRRSSFEMESPDVCKHLDEVMVYWNKYSPVFINAGTGAGKTTFSIEFVCNMARQKKQNVLYITNREGLSNQYNLGYTCILKDS